VSVPATSKGTTQATAMPIATARADQDMDTAGVMDPEVYPCPWGAMQTWPAATRMGP
jgi:hypothetical protein